jgi:hypothetical protein
MKQARLIPVLVVLVGATLLPWSPAGAAPAHKLRCFGREANVVGTSGDDVFQLRDHVGGPLVVVGLGGSDELIAPWASAKVEVYYCGGSGKDGARGNVNGMNGGGGKDWARFQCVPSRLKSVERWWNEDC